MVFEIDDEARLPRHGVIEGQSLKDKISARPLPLEEALDIAMQACAGLQAAHEKGVVHRDIKPANLMLTAPGALKIMDFGLAQVGDRTRITQTGTSLGTPAYMSPEQASGGEVDRRTDIWSLAVVLYEMVTGRLPFRGDTAAALMRGVMDAEPEPLPH
jgi:serine/threonine-protein kinase